MTRVERYTETQWWFLMPELTYKDYIPANARVLVDYTQPPQERVKFAYPEEMTYEKAYKKFWHTQWIDTPGEDGLQTFVGP